MIDFLNSKSIRTPRGEVASITRNGETLWQKVKYKRELEYLESTGTQWIDTGIVGNQNTSYEIDASTSFDEDTYMVLFGSRQSASANVITTLVGGGGSIVNDFGNYSVTRQTYSNVSGKTRYTIHNSKDKRSVYNHETGETETVTTKYTGNVSTPTNLYIGYKSSGFTNTMLNFIGQIYSCKIWQGTVLVYDLIPVLDWNDTPCMYDKVTNEFFYNQGTGEFLYA